MRLPLETRALAALLAVAALVGCNGGSAVTLQPQPSPTPRAVAYTAIGASDAVGYGASVPCANPPLVAVPACPGGTGYVPDLARLLTGAGDRVALNDLGISGSVVGPKTLALVNAYDSASSATPCQPRPPADAYTGDFITDELPKVTGSETLITIFAGGNDTNGITDAAVCLALGGATTAQVQTFVTNAIAQFGQEFAQLYASLHAKAPNALIVVANLPNFAGIPFTQVPSLAQIRPLIQQVSVGIDTSVYAPLAAQGVPVVDLLCDPQSYVASNFYTDGFHPDDAGYADIAQLYFAQITAAKPIPPQSSCSFESLASVASRLSSVGLPNLLPHR
jgi:lysophospholipase L1-like esterase